MSDITLRGVKEAPLTNDELDANFTNLNADKLESTDLSVSTGAASGGGTLSYSAGVFTFAPADLSSYITDLSSFTTTDLTEGTNLYYTDERVDDRVNSLIQAGLGITTSYDDINNELTIESDTIEELCKNGTGSTILKGTPVYQTGTAGNAMVIAPADASSAATMPAVGVLSQDLAAAAEGSLILMGRISGVNTSAFSEGDVIYVASGGGYTNVRPTGQSVLVQNLGRVTKVDASNGGGVVMGSGRANDVPNLTDGNIFIGNASGTYDKRAIVTADISDLTATAAEINTLDGITATTTELNYTDGVTSNIQTQLNAKGVGSVTSVGGTGTVQGLTLSGTVTSSGNLTLGGSLSDVNLASQVTGTLPVANGGTGSTSLTSNNVILGNGTSAVQTVAPGTSGNVLKSNGTTWVSEAAGAALTGVTDSSSPFLTALGVGAGAVNTGAGNVALGYSALNSNTTGQSNTAIGFNAAAAVITAQSIVAIGHNALLSATTASNNIAIGPSALRSVTTAQSNIAIGESALLNCTGGPNIAIGRQAAYYTTTGTRNTTTGWAALFDNTTGTDNTAFGHQAGDQITTGTQNVTLGSGAASSGTNDLTTGSNNIIVGYNAAASSASVSNEITLGNSSISALRCQVTTISSLSDARDKTNISDLPAGLEFINALRPVEFDWDMRDGGKVGVHDTGFIAQDLLSAQESTGVNIPDLVRTIDPDRLEAGYGKLIPVLVQAIKELSAQVEELKSKSE